MSQRPAKRPRKYVRCAACARFCVAEDQLVEPLDDAVHVLFGDLPHRRQPGEVAVGDLEVRAPAAELCIIELQSREHGVPIHGTVS
jgi:hypothetical protein